MEEASAQAAFQLRDLMTDRALADAKLDRSAGEVEMACSRLEGPQRVKWELGTVHNPPIKYSHGFVDNSYFVARSADWHSGDERKEND